MDDVKFEGYESWWFILLMFLLFPLVIPFFIALGCLGSRNEKIAAHEHKIVLDKVKKEIDSIPKHEIAIDSSAKLKRARLSDMPEIKFKNITKRTNLATIPAFAVIDVETTGLSAGSDRIIELSSIIYEDFEPVETFSTLVNTKKHISEEASEINHIHDEDITSAPPLDSVSGSFVGFIKNLPVVGYNVAFDLKFLYCSGINIMDGRKIYDVYALSKRAFKGLDSYSLSNVALELGITYSPHRSLDDCFATGAVFKAAAHELTDD